MIVLIVSKCPPKLKGDLSKWLFEVSPGVFTGNPSKRVREKLWERVLSVISDGKATMVYSARTEQGFKVRTTGNDWTPIDFDGVCLMKHPAKEAKSQVDSRPRKVIKSPVKTTLALNSSNKAVIRKESDMPRFPGDDYSVVDLETTGLHPESDRIIQIGIVKIRNREFDSSKSIYIRIANSVPKIITEITGITDELLIEKGVSEREALEEMKIFLGNDDLVFHNAKFDLSFLQRASEEVLIEFKPSRTFDTLYLARSVLSDVENYKLKTLLDYFGIQSQDVHTGVGDAIGTFKLMEKLRDCKMRSVGDLKIQK